MQNYTIHKVAYEDIAYPQLLKNIYQAPPVLYVKGNLDLCNTAAIAIVGSRKATDYGKRVAKEMAAGIAQHKWTIISGLAKGIDAKAHEGALLVKGKTIAIVAGGVNYIYPKENQKLYEQILAQGGAIISEKGIDDAPEKQDFVRRNRLITGMAQGLLVVEAASKSGTSTTVEFALEQGREVFAVPGNITSLQSKGTNALIREGAKCVLQVEDILEEW